MVSITSSVRNADLMGRRAYKQVGVDIKKWSSGYVTAGIINPSSRAQTNELVEGSMWVFLVRVLLEQRELGGLEQGAL